MKNYINVLKKGAVCVAVGFMFSIPFFGMYMENRQETKFREQEQKFYSDLNRAMNEDPVLIKAFGNLENKL